MADKMHLCAGTCSTSLPEWSVKFTSLLRSIKYNFSQPRQGNTFLCTVDSIAEMLVVLRGCLELSNSLKFGILSSGGRGNTKLWVLIFGIPETGVQIHWFNWFHLWNALQIDRTIQNNKHLDHTAVWHLRNCDKINSMLYLSVQLCVKLVRLSFAVLVSICLRLWCGIRVDHAECVHHMLLCWIVNTSNRLALRSWTHA